MQPWDPKRVNNYANQPILTMPEFQNTTTGSQINHKIEILARNCLMVPNFRIPNHQNCCMNSMDTEPHQFRQRSVCLRGRRTRPSCSDLQNPKCFPNTSWSIQPPNRIGNTSFPKFNPGTVVGRSIHPRSATTYRHLVLRTRTLPRTLTSLGSPSFPNRIGFCVQSTQPRLDRREVQGDGLDTRCACCFWSVVATGFLIVSSPSGVLLRTVSIFLG